MYNIADSSDCLGHGANHTTVSCTIILGGIHSEWNMSHSVFIPSLPIPTTDFREHLQVGIVGLVPLVFSLQIQATCVPSSIPASLHAIISDAHFPYGYSFATLRVLPPEGVNHRSPLYGFRELQLHNYQPPQLPVTMEVPPHLAFEVLAIDPMHPGNRSLVQVWGPFGLTNLAHHFVLFTEAITQVCTLV